MWQLSRSVRIQFMDDYCKACQLWHSTPANIVTFFFLSKNKNAQNSELKEVMAIFYKQFMVQPCLFFKPQYVWELHCALRNEAAGGKNSFSFFYDGFESSETLNKLLLFESEQLTPKPDISICRFSSTAFLLFNVVRMFKNILPLKIVNNR